MQLYVDIYKSCKLLRTVSFLAHPVLKLKHHQDNFQDFEHRGVNQLLGSPHLPLLSSPLSPSYSPTVEIGP